jgi:hypothetical protein
MIALQPNSRDVILVWWNARKLVWPKRVKGSVQLTTLNTFELLMRQTVRLGQTLKRVENLLGFFLYSLSMDTFVELKNK